MAMALQAFAVAVGPADVFDRCAIHVELLMPEPHASSFRSRSRFRYRFSLATLALSVIKRASVGSHTSVGSARVEMEMLDSRTETRLIAAVDERAGKKVTGKFDKWEKWQDAQDAYDYWSGQLRTRLAELRAGK